MRQNLAYHTSALQADRIKAFRLVGLQFLVAFALAICWIFVDFLSAVSAILGGLACVLPNLYFAYRFFAVGSVRETKKILKAFYWGESMKLLLSASLVIIIFSEIKVSALPFFTGFVGAHMGFWLAPLLVRAEARVVSQ